MKMVKFHDRDETVVNLDNVNYITTRKQVVYFTADYVDVIDIRFNAIEYSLIYPKEKREEYQKDLDFINNLLYK